MSYNVQVPGTVPVLSQPSSLVCWATVFTMMKSWKDSTSYEISDAVGSVGARYLNIFQNNNVLITTLVPQFMQDANMTLESMQDLNADGWSALLNQYGPLWVGTLNQLGPSGGLHSRIVQGLSGDGSGDNTFFAIVDPAGGRTYGETMTTFMAKYDGAYQFAGDPFYYQIRHW